MDPTIDLPEPEMFIGSMIKEKCSFQCGVISSNHGKTVEAQDVSFFKQPCGKWVVGTVSVDARLEPGPSVHQVTVWVTFSNSLDHRMGRMPCNGIFRNSLTEGFDTGLTS
jgi:hypothetical protein